MSPSYLYLHVLLLTAWIVSLDPWLICRAKLKVDKGAAGRQHELWYLQRSRFHQAFITRICHGPVSFSCHRVLVLQLVIRVLAIQPVVHQALS